MKILNCIISEQMAMTMAGETLLLGTFGITN